MGLFTQRPEENEEWAGLPSEPLRPESDAERLTAPAADAASLGIGGGFESIPVTLPPAALDPEPASSGSGDPEDEAVG